MQKLITLLLVISFATLSIGCGGAGSGTVGGDQAKAGIAQAIAKAEAELYGNPNAVSFDQAKAQKVIDVYGQYAEQFPKDDKTAEYLFKSAEIHRSLKQYDEAIKTYQHIHDKHPSYAKAPHSLFLLGFSYENDKKDQEKARGVYEQFLAKYPKHELADDVQFSLKNLGKTPEQIIKEFEENVQKATSEQDSTTKEASAEATKAAETSTDAAASKATKQPQLKVAKEKKVEPAK